MKKITRLLLLAALAAAPIMSFAQDLKKRSNEQLSDYYKYEISAMEKTIKANKDRQKANPTDTTLRVEERNMKAQLETMKDLRKTIDAAIQAEKESKKAQAKAKDAREDAKAAEAKKIAAKKLADNAIESNPDNRTYEQMSDYYKFEISAVEKDIKANKDRLKNNPKDESLKALEQSKKAELETLKAKKKAVDGFIKAAVDYEKASTKAQNAQQEAEKALQKAKSAAEAADKAIGR